MYANTPLVFDILLSTSRLLLKECTNEKTGTSIKSHKIHTTGILIITLIIKLCGREIPDLAILQCQYEGFGTELQHLLLMLT
jgi:hypothetical protein